MKERPILFSAPMVRAIIEGRKTQTRRVIKPQPLWIGEPNVPFKTNDANPKGIIKCPYGRTGDRLWVREPHCHLCGDDTFCFPSDGFIYCMDCNLRPAMFLPRSASRIMLEITGVRVERVRDIKPCDAIAEGITPTYYNSLDCATENPCNLFRSLWNSINAKRGFGWDVNPWVWVIEFKKIDDK